MGKSMCQLLSSGMKSTQRWLSRRRQVHWLKFRRLCKQTQHIVTLFLMHDSVLDASVTSRYLFIFVDLIKT